MPAIIFLYTGGGPCSGACSCCDARDAHKRSQLCVVVVGGCGGGSAVAAAGGGGGGWWWLWYVAALEVLAAATEWGSR